MHRKFNPARVVDCDGHYQICRSRFGGTVDWWCGRRGWMGASRAAQRYYSRFKSRPNADRKVAELNRDDPQSVDYYDHEEQHPRHDEFQHQLMADLIGD